MSGDARTPPGGLGVDIEAIYRAARAHVGSDGDAPTAPARPAVAAILWRPDAGGRGIEILLVRRSPALAFAGGQWAFPGGRVEDSDTGDGVVGATGEEARFIAAAIREVGEETGVVLPPDASRFEDAGLWVTPAFSPIRFAARYVLVRAPGDARPDPARSGGEIVDAAWLAPGRALDRWADGLLPLSAPVRRALVAIGDRREGAADRVEAAAPLENDGPRVWEIAGGVALSPLRTPTLPPATHTNCFLVGEREVVVVDPASPHEEERHVLDDILAGWQGEGRRVVAIYLTHHHADHVGGAAYLAGRLGVPVCAHPVTARLLGQRVRVDRLLDDGDVLPLAGVHPARLRAVHTPGHAPGHLCFLEERTGMLIAGDMVAGVGTILIAPGEGDMSAYIDSLERMKRLGARALLPAHGPVITEVEQKLDGYLRHRRWREQRVRDALRAGGGVASSLVRVVYDDTPASLHPLAELSLIAHLEDLQRRGLARRDSDGQWRD